MINYLKLDNYIIDTPIITILRDLRGKYFNGKLKDIRINSSDISVTCVNDNHAEGREKNPDAHINLNSDKAAYGWYHCFACGCSFSFVGFISNYFSCTYDSAKKWLIDNYGVKAEDAILIDDEINLLQPSTSGYLNESILDNYQKWTPYLAKRKLSRDICEKFKVRYDPYLRQVIFPVYNIYGKLVMLARRSIDTKFFHMDDEINKEVYALNIIQKNNVKSAIITEGPFDALTSWTYGFPAIATLGEISDYQIEQLNKSCLNAIYTMFDNDSAGKKFTNIILNKINKRILVIPIKIPNGFKDLNDLDEKTFKLLLENVQN